MKLTHDEVQYWDELRRKEHRSRAKCLRGAKRNVRRIQRSVNADEPKETPAVKVLATAGDALNKCGPHLENLAAQEFDDQFALDAGFIGEGRGASDDSSDALDIDLGDSDDLFVTPASAEETTGISRADLLAAAKQGEIFVRAWKFGLFYYAPGLLSFAESSAQLPKV